MPTLTSTASFLVSDQAVETVATAVTVLPAISYPTGNGRLVHPTLGTYDYEYKPDEWVNILGDVIIAPTWASSKTLAGAAHALWPGDIRDVVCEERWKALGGMAIPITQLQMLMAIWTTPVDPSVGYVQWFPNYTTNIGYNILPLDLVVGSAGSSSQARLSGIGYQVVVFDDVINSLDSDGNPYGWVDMPVTFFIKVVGYITSAIPVPLITAGG